MTPHGNAGRKQSPEHVAKRVAALRAQGVYAKNGLRIAALNVSRTGIPISAEQKAKQSAAMQGKQNALGIVRSEKFRRNLSEYWTGNPEHNFRVDGKGAERHSERVIAMGQLDYRLWREAVFKRDGYTCVSCGQHGGVLEADHILPWRTHEALRYEIDNGRTLCPRCHHQTPTWGKRGTELRMT